jgi:hypothetical protein
VLVWRASSVGVAAAGKCLATAASRSRISSGHPDDPTRTAR